ncbi:putative mitochondrial protein AtMg00310 [Apium graveolens]|uniref:putative mitochondrial protein AtMg00310 n=1 Tax=Apium graveolens TaxID=4045 RepID=UPI003D7B3806
MAVARGAPSVSHLLFADDCYFFFKVHETATPGRYLGMPMNVGRNKVEVFGFLKDNVHQKLQAGICEDIERKMNGFLWGRGVTRKGVKWMSWSRICMPRGCGGLGVRDLLKFNLAMLAKHDVGKNLSYIWRSLMEAMDVVKAGARRKIGDGCETRVWNVP